MNEDGTSPFECTICLESFNATLNIPTCLACGHSICISHIQMLDKCPVCRCTIANKSTLKPNYALRDASVFYTNLLATSEVEHLHQSSEVGLSDEEFARRLQLQFDNEDAERPPPPGASSSPPSAAAAVSAPVPAIAASGAGGASATHSIGTHSGPMECKCGHASGLCNYPLDKSRIHLVASCKWRCCGRAWSEPGCTAHVAPLVVPGPAASSSSSSSSSSSASVGMLGRMLGFLHQHQENSPRRRAEARAAGQASGGSSSSSSYAAAKACGHRCSPSSLARCCACSDVRPAQAEGSYSVYRDGAGWVDAGRRSDGYCPVCKNQ